MKGRRNEKERADYTNTLHYITSYFLGRLKRKVKLDRFDDILKQERSDSFKEQMTMHFIFPTKRN